MTASSITASMLGLTLVLLPITGAQAAELKVLAGGSMTVSLNELKPRFEQATGNKLTIVFDSTPNLIKAATSGSPFDLGVVPVDFMKYAAARALRGRADDRCCAGRLRRRVPGGRPKPDMSTP